MALTMQPVLHVPAFEDNYIWLIRGRSTGQVAIVDPGDAEPVLEALESLSLTPIAILCTHHHGDHTGGNRALKARYPDIAIYGPADENIPGRTHVAGDGDRVSLEALGVEFDVLRIPGHTRGHIAYFGHGWLFCGDTIFSAGCGRLFEGTAEQMHESLSRLASLPGSTLVYCAHEYTRANLRFAQAVEPDNPDIGSYRSEVDRIRARGEPTLPTTLARELKINPFLRSESPAVRLAAETYAGTALADSAAVFAAVRRWKDNFR